MPAEPDPKRLGAKGKPIVKGSETIYEIIRGKDGFGFGLSLVRITDGWNETHYHDRTKELYVVIWGGLEVELAYLSRHKHPRWRSSPEYLKPGESVTIIPGKGHRARAFFRSIGWFYVFTYPLFDPADYYPIT